MLSAIGEWKQEQERIRLENMSKLGIWTVRYYVDNFGNLTKKGYITTAKPISGRFSNSATTDSKLNVGLLIDTNNVCIQLYEYGDQLQKVPTGKTDTYTIQVQGDNGYVFNFTGVNTSDGVELDGVGVLHNMLIKSKALKFYMVEAGSYGSTYNFNIDDTSYYENAIRMLTEG